MTYVAITPLASQSPGLFPAACNTNFVRLQTIISGDHIFNLSAATNDGIHKQVSLLNYATDPSSLTQGNNCVVYSKLVTGVTQLFFYNGASVQQLTSGGGSGSRGVVASVNFDATQNPILIRSSFNVASVTRIFNSVGTFAIAFATPLSNANFVVSVTGMRNEFNKTISGYVCGNGAYGSSVSANAVSYSICQ